MKTKKPNLDDFTGCELSTIQKTNIKAGKVPPIDDEDGGPRSGSTNNGDVKDPSSYMVLPEILLQPVFIRTGRTSRTSRTSRR
ncbi:hypothetical protein NAT51_18835 [Flavobacterium amniphilum]|uniref:hypothetical protein n=1 Tax=Flavobacterium amniphilum TaxID=1834035 RepID=UPI002029FBE7|nr:hypothetical protein [Flavobacterium amniphilum]MCL9807586.1 hypothetical protein [Flavobacterium amniphilum]